MKMGGVIIRLIHAVSKEPSLFVRTKYLSLVARFVLKLGPRSDCPIKDSNCFKQDTMQSANENFGS